MVFVCPTCKAVVRADRVPAGCSVRCPKCGTVYRPDAAPAPARDSGDSYAIRPAPPTPQYEPLVPTRPYDGTSGRVRAPRHLSRGFSQGFGWLVGVVFAVFCCFITAMVLYKVIEVAVTKWEDHQAVAQAPSAGSPSTGSNSADSSMTPLSSPRASSPDSRPSDEAAAAGNGAGHASPGRTYPPAARESGFRVTSARFYYIAGEPDPAPVIEISARNDTGRTVTRLDFCATLSSSSRTKPLASDYFTYKVEGGLKPGEEARWQLIPDSGTDWGSAPRDSGDLDLKVVPIEIEASDGAVFSNWSPNGE